MGGIESSYQGPYKQHPRVSFFSPNPRLQARGRVSQQSKHFMNKNATPHQLPIRQQSFIHPQPQEYLMNSNASGSSLVQTVSQQRNRTNSLPYLQLNDPITLARKIKSPQSDWSPSTIDPISDGEFEILPTCQIRFMPQIKASMLRKKGERIVNKRVKMSRRILEIDDLRTNLRAIQSHIHSKLLPRFNSDIEQMNDLIEVERKGQLKNKNKVFFLLIQKHHYMKLYKRFVSYNERIKDILLVYRNKDSLQNITQHEFNGARALKSEIENLINNIRRDNPVKGWCVLIDRPNSQLYKNAVNSAIYNQQIVTRYKQLEQSLTNPALLETLQNEGMLESFTRRVGEQIEPIKIIEGPTHDRVDSIKEQAI